MKARLMELIEREKSHLAKQEVGSEEYCASLRRLMDLEKQLAELEVNEHDKKDKVVRNIYEGVKTASGIAIPLIGLVWITATEKETTFTGVLKEYTRYFLPKKML